MGLIFVVGCGRKKARQAAEAQNLYVSRTFQLSRRVAEFNGDAWLVLSGRYGLLEPRVVVSPYDDYVGGWHHSKHLEWSTRVAQELLARTSSDDVVVVLARDQAYTKVVCSYLEQEGRTTLQPYQSLNKAQCHAWCRMML